MLLLASVAAMQGRIAMYHALGEAVWPLNLKRVSSNIFTGPEIATVGQTQTIDAQRDSPGFNEFKLPLDSQPAGQDAGLQRRLREAVLAARASARSSAAWSSRPRASELIHPITMAVDLHLTVDQVASAFTVYPSLSGSIAEAARRLHADVKDED